MKTTTLALILAASLSGCLAALDPAIGISDEAATVCAAGPTVEGLDVSGYQGTIDWKSVAAAGKKFAIAKATEGTGFTDSTFAANWSGMKSAGVIRGAYHFFHANLDPTAQAQHFASVVGTLAADDLPPMLDLEVADGQTAATVASTARTWLTAVEKLTGKKPIVYTGPSFFRDTLGNPSGFETYPLVIANYGVSCPDVPGAWPTWTMWQYSSSGSVAGISGAIDEDRFNGDLAALQKLAAGGAPDPCFGLVDGSYCGGDGITGDKSTLFVCKGGAVASQTKCAAGCKYNPPGTPDACNPAPPPTTPPPHDGGAGGDMAPGAPPAGGDDGGSGGGVGGNGGAGGNGAAPQPFVGKANGGCALAGAPVADGWLALALIAAALALATRRRRA